jgi:hypothetical protein
MRRVLCTLLGSLFALTIAAAFDAASVSNLRGKTLEPIKSNQLKAPARELKDLNLNDLIGAFAATPEKNPTVEIKQIEVLEDRHTQLKFRLQYACKFFPTVVTIAAITGQGAHPGIAAAKITLAEAEGETEVVLKANQPWSTKEALPFETEALSFLSGKTNQAAQLVGSAALSGQLYGCPKKWVPVPQHIIATPVGLALKAPANPGQPAVPVLVKKYIDAMVKFQQATSILQLQAAQGRVNPEIIRMQQEAAAALSQATATGAAPKGPSPTQVFGISDFSSSLPIAEGTMPAIFQDLEPASGIFYYKPTRFALAWKPAGQYALKVIYGAAKSDGNAPVTLAATLVSNIDSADLAAIESLIRQSGMPFVALRPFPLATAPAYTLAASLASYGIKPENISIIGANEKGTEMEVRIVTDAVTQETLETILTDGLGLGGELIFEAAAAAGQERAKVAIPAMLRLADTQSFGTMKWTRGPDGKMPVKNTTPYPMKLEALNVMWFNGAEKVVYSYGLGDVVLAPGDTTNLVLGDVPGWMDSHASVRRRWIQYSILPDSITDQTILMAGTEGASQVKQSKITVNLLAWKEKAPGAVAVLVELRGKGFDSRQQTSSTKQMTFQSDGEKQESEPFYLPRSGSIKFDYRVGVVMDDGSQKWMKGWLAGTATNIFIGLKQIQQALTDNP